MSKLQHYFPVLLLVVLHSPPRISAVDLLFNGFNSSDLLLYGDATLASGGSYLSLTSPTNYSIGRALYPHKLPLTSANSTSTLSFSTSFLFSISPSPPSLPGHGLAFLLSPLPGLRGSVPAQHLGLFNRSTNDDPSNGVVAVEFDVFRNEEFEDIDDNHVGIDIFSLTSAASHSAGYWSDESRSFVPVTLNDGSNYQVWIDYSDRRLNVTIAPVYIKGKPTRALISHPVDLSGILQPEMYAGYCASTGKLIQNHQILGWSFSNSKLSLAAGLITSGLPDFTLRPGRSSRALIAGVSSALVAALILVAAIALARLLRTPEMAQEAEEWESDYWPHRIAFGKIAAATGGFAEGNLIGSGGDGRVYRGELCGAAVAVKRLWRGTGAEARGFLAEVSSLGRLRHRNLVGLKGWCKRGGEFFLVYDYMENGSLDRRIFHAQPLDWGSRVRILRDVAKGVMYMHEGWERKVVHRDIKASNVMLGGDMVGKLGDFGLARMHEHGGVPRTSVVVGTAGYMAPEVVRRGRATTAADVYGFGVLVLEVACGRCAAMVEAGTLVEWVWGSVVGEVVDPRVRGTEGFDEEEAGMVVRLGMWCTSEEPWERPSMREVVGVLDGGREGAGLVDERLGKVAERKARVVGRGQPAWEEVRWERSLSLSPSLSESDRLLEGR